MASLKVIRIIWRGAVTIFILFVFSTMSQAYSEDLLGYWNFNSVENNIVPDLSGNELNGVLTDVVVEENGGIPGTPYLMNGDALNSILL